MVGIKIKQLRDERRMSQKALAAEVKMGTTAINNYENGHRIPDADTVIRLADFFGVTTDYLLDRSFYRNDTDKGDAEKRAGDIAFLLADLRPEARSLFLPALEDFLLGLGGAVSDSSFALMQNLTDYIGCLTNIKIAYSGGVSHRAELERNEDNIMRDFIMEQGVIPAKFKALLADASSTARRDIDALSQDLILMFERDLGNEVKVARLNAQGDITPRRTGVSEEG